MNASNLFEPLISVHDSFFKVKPTQDYKFSHKPLVISFVNTVLISLLINVIMSCFFF